MFVFAAVLSVLLSVVGLAAGLPKALLKGSIPAQLQSPGGFSAPLVRFIGLAELAAAAGLIAGLFWQPIGVAAALGFAVLLVGAVGFHAKSGDYANPETRGNAMAPIILTVIAIAAAATLVLAS
ncbi:MULTISPECIES: DoxX family protein [Streptomyces]|uniref:DoxX family protein n=1 Tax=Streptomyces TaxID=1883 RepID=UPI002251E4AD|nr:DoxX family protein [Streptomyces canus]WSS90380.1 DoxX family protein [Streptomyces phaeochromogenes]MCX4860403.1 DoxX family protein [Streptomyces canus]WSW11580.1 DoxX family protein [Streptomyces phaeochromogenes]WSW34393.1 DoxX family protein [Streptomyces canus]WTA09931.1 DoxX family protein [Streptomyces phaeochromogenes]